MPPQPIDQVKRGARYRLHFDSLDDRREVAQAMAECIAKWSGVEQLMGLLFVSLLRINEHQGAELYAAYEGATAKRNAMRALCVASLSEPESELVHRLQKYVASQQKLRDKLGHWLVGTSEEIPDSLILVDPKTTWGAAGGSIQDWRQAAASREARTVRSRPIPREKVYAYSIKSIKADTEAFVRLGALILQFCQLVSSQADPERLALFDLLSRDARLGTS